MTRDIVIKVSVNANELEAIDAKAQLEGMSRSQYCRHKALGKPLKAAKPYYKAHGRYCSPCSRIRNFAHVIPSTSEPAPLAMPTEKS